MTPTTPKDKPAKRDADDVYREKGHEGLKAEIGTAVADDPGLAIPAYVPPIALSALLADPDVLHPPPRIASGFPALDHGLEGGFVPGNTYLLAGLTGRGKSLLAINLCLRMARRGTPVLMISLEDSQAATGRKFLASDSGVPMKRLEHFDHLSEEEKGFACAAGARLAGLPLRVDAHNANLDAVEAVIRAEVASGIRVVVLDQTSWLVVNNTENAFQEVSQLSRRLAVLARELKAVFVLLVQVNRQGANAQSEGKSIELHHLRDSGRLEQDASGVLAVQRLDTSTDPAVLHLDILKHRGGPRDLAITLLARLRCAQVEDDAHALESRPRAEPVGGDQSVRPSASGLTTEEFVRRYYTTTPKTLAKVKLEAERELKAYRVEEFFEKAKAGGLIHSWGLGPRGHQGYATLRPPETQPSEDGEASGGRKPPHTPPPVQGTGGGRSGFALSPVAPSRSSKKSRPRRADPRNKMLPPPISDDHESRPARQP